ncbi:MAG: YiiG family protein [Myxococcota bacterium]
MNCRFPAALLTVCLALGCSDNDAPEPVPAATTPANSDQAPAPVVNEQEQADQQLGEKLGEYVRHCLNRHSRSVSRARQSYTGWIGGESGPTGEERHVFGVHELTVDATLCTEAVARAAAMPPAHEGLHTAGTQYVAALSAVIPKVNEAHVYYERENYKDDDFAGGRELHPELMQRWSDFSAADQGLSLQVQQLQREIDNRRIAALESDPARRTRFLIERARLSAETIADLAGKVELDDELRYGGVDAEELSDAVTSFETHADELDRHVQSGPSDLPSNGDRFASSVTDLVAAAKLLMRNVRDGNQVSASEASRLGTPTGSTIEGSPDSLIDGYNDLINAYNRMR